MKEESRLFVKESYATGLVRPKTTALFFDKLWVPYYLTTEKYRDEIGLEKNSGRNTFKI